MRLLALFLPLLCLAQAPLIGIIDIYGTRRTSRADIRKAASVVPGGRLPSSKSSVEYAILRIPTVADVSVEAACCDSGKIIFYIGIAEKGIAPIKFRENPTEGPDIPELITEAYQRFLHQVNEATRAGVTGEDLSEGHSLMTYAPARQEQQAFIDLATGYLSELRAVLRTSATEDHRAMAAYVLGYHKDKKMVIDDLNYALTDNDPVVRGNAVRALAAIAIYAQRDPDAGIVVDATPLVAMLNSIVWTDRNYAAVALVSMTESRDVALLAIVRKQALSALLEMARWKHEPHALPGYILLGRTASIPEPELQSAWSSGQREGIIARASGRPLLPPPSKTQPVPPGRP